MLIFIYKWDFKKKVRRKSENKIIEHRACYENVVTSIGKTSNSKQRTDSIENTEKQQTCFPEE